MTFEEMAEARYSVKKFADTAIEQEKLDKVLEVACKAPTAKNAQAARIYVLKSKDAVAKAGELTACVYGAPVVLLFTYNRDEIYHYPQEPEHHSGDEDCSIVATHVMFEARELGLGTCWVNNFTPAKAKSLFEIPENEEPVLLMPIGYAHPEFQPLPPHTRKRPMEEIVHLL
ncbi:MAG: nitroreductase family protein [Lachnospiraceae bacterium]|nr:nitroreductase family protein [Lachnospiraceae bacterium]